MLSLGNLTDCCVTLAGSRVKNRLEPDIKLCLSHSLLWEYEHYELKKYAPLLFTSGFKKRQ